MLLNLTLVTSNLEHVTLHQRLAEWETAVPVPARRIYTLPERLPVARATIHAEVESPRVLWHTAIVHDDVAGRWSITGTAAGPGWPVLELAPEMRTPDDRFVIEGEVKRGSITMGLLRGDKWADGTNLTISAAGRFIAVLVPSAPGLYGVLFANGIEHSWFLRHASAQVAQLAGRFHVFNNARILKAGWSLPPAVPASSIPPRDARR